MSRSIETTAGRTALIIAALTLLTGMGVLAPSAAAADFTWTGAVSSDWFTAGNWSPSGIPGADDTATIDVPGGTTVDIPADASVSRLDFRGGTIQGAGALTITGTLTWTGGRMKGPGTTVIANGATANLSAGGQRILEGGRVFNNAGTFNCSGGDFGRRCFFDQAGSYTLNNSGTIDVSADVSINGGVIHNTGTVRKSAGSGTALINAGLTNNGTVEVLSGTKSFGIFTATVTHNGSFNVAAGTTLDFFQGVHNLPAGSSVSGAGAVTFNAETLNVGGNYNPAGSTTINNGVVNFNTDVTIPLLNFNNGVLGGSATVTIPALNWTGGRMNGPGTTVIPAGATASAPAGLTRVLAGGRVFNNAGTFSCSGGDFGRRCILAQGTYTFNNTGTIDFTADVSFTSGGVVNNSGIVRKSAGVGTTSINASFTNNGSVEVQSGTLSLGILNTTVTHNGMFLAPAGTTLEFFQGIHNLAAPSSVSGPGNVTFRTVAAINGSYSVTGTTTIDGPGDTIASFNNAPTIPTLHLRTGQLGGSGTVTVGVLTWTGDSGLSGTGTLIIPAGGTMTIGGDPTHTLFLNQTRTIINEGTIIFRGIQSVALRTFGGVQASITIDNRGLFDIQPGRPFGDGDRTTSAFNNSGTFRKSAGSGTASVGAKFAFTNSGTVEVLTGTLLFTGIYTQNAGVTLLNGGTLAHSPTPFISQTAITINGGALAGTGIINGNVINSGILSPGLRTGEPGTLTVTGNYTQTATGSYNVDILGTTPGAGFDQLITSSGFTSSLNGILNIFRRDGFVPAANESFQIARAVGTQKGAFKAVNGTDTPTSTGAGVFVVNYTDFDVVLLASSQGGGTGSASPRPWIDFIGPEETRIGRAPEFETSASYTVKYGNSAIASSGVVIPITIILPPGAINIVLDGVAHEPLEPAAMTPEELAAFMALPLGFQSEDLLDDPTGGRVVVPIFAFAAPGARNEFTITFTAPCPPPPGGTEGAFQVEATMSEPIDFEALGGCSGKMLEFALGFIPGADCVKLALKVLAKIGTSAASGQNAFTGSAAIFSLLTAGGKCAASIFPVANAIKKVLELLSIVSKANTGSSFAEACSNFVADTVGDRKASATTGCLSARDPNAKYGSQGFSGARYISGETPVHYLVTFENVPDASAPAQIVTITDQLDASFNLDSFYFETMSFGEHTITPPPASTDFVGDVDLRPANDLIVRIEAKLDVPARLATWRFSTIDPETGQPVDPFSVEGFLPPNVNPPEGEGSVSFSVELEEGFASGTTIRNNALIIFDQNDAIDTGEWLNTIDNAKPSSSVGALPGTVTTESFPVQWSGTDADSGIAHFSIFVSEDEGPFELWLRNTTATSADFPGEQGKSYGFFSLARDNTGNEQNAKQTADATTTVTVNTDQTPPVTTAALSQPPNAAGWHKADLSVALNAADAESGVKEISYTVTLGTFTSGGTTDGASALIPITAEGISTITFFARDNAANTEAQQTITVRLDKTAPVIACASPNGAWNAGNVSLGCTASDGVSGLANAADASFSLSTSVAEGVETADATTGSRSITDVAGNTSPAGPIAGNKVDRKAPAITTSSPAAISYLLNQAVAAAYSCADGGSGVATCAGNVASGAAIDTASIGSKLFTVQAADAVANLSNLSVNYAVTYKIRALYDVAKEHKSNSTIPIKIQLTDAANANMSSQSIIVTALATSLLSNWDPEDPEDAGNANPDDRFRFTDLDGSDGYIYNLKTTGLAAGTYVLIFSVAGDPIQHTTQFRIR